MQFYFLGSDQKILNGKPIITRSIIRVEFTSARSVESVYKEYSYLRKGSVDEAIRYAALIWKE